MACFTRLGVCTTGKWALWDLQKKKKKLVFSGIDRKTLAKTEEECVALKKLSLDEGLAVLFLKQSESSGSPQSEADDAFNVLEELNSKQQRRDSVERLVESRHDICNSDWGPVRAGLSFDTPGK